jgi:hypothetical protein
LDEENPTHAHLAQENGYLAQENGFWLRIIAHIAMAGGEKYSSTVHMQK